MWDAIAMANYQYNDWKGKNWKSIKTDVLDTSNKMLQTQLKNLPKEIKYFKGFNTVNEKITNMGKILPLISSLHSEFMEKRHWEELKQITKQDFDPYSPAFNFADVLKLELYRFENQVNEIVDKAQKEAKIEKILKNIESDWNGQVFEFEELKDATKIFKGMDDMLELLDTNTMDLLGMTSQGKYVEFFRAKVDDWRGKLRSVGEVVTVWMKMQKNWKRLVNIFLNSEDIRQTLSEDTKKFEAVDSEFKQLMSEVSNSPGVIENCFPEHF
jgi:dynein heavy chain